MFNNFDMSVVNIFKNAELERIELKHPYVGTEHLLLSLLKNDQEISDYFKSYNLTYSNFKKELIMVVGKSNLDTEINLYTPMLKRVINCAILNASENNNNQVTNKHLLIAILEEGEGIAIRLLIGMGINIDKVYDELNNYKLSNKQLEIYNIGNVLNDSVNDDEKVIGRDKEISLIIETLLRKKKNNPILIGDAGVGKTAIVEELVRRIKRKEVPECLYDAKVVSLEMGSLLSGTKYRGEFEEKLTKIVKELEKENNIILFIDEIHSMVNAGGAEGAINASDILKPALARGNIKCIGATTLNEYNKFFTKDSALMRRFEIVLVKEPDKEETKEILLKIKGEYEKHHNVIIKEDLIDKVIDYTDKFIHNKMNPDKAIDFLDSVCSSVRTLSNYNLENRKLYQELEKLNKNKNLAIKNNDYEKALDIYNKETNISKKIKNNILNRNIEIKEEDIKKVLENKTNLILTNDKIKILDNIILKANNKLYGLEREIKQVIDFIKSNILKQNYFLKFYFKGAKYLGKSSLVKLISENIPNSDFIRIDLNEYKNSYDIDKLIGINKGYAGYNDEHLFSNLKNNNFTIILFDNFNAACEDVKTLIKEILKEKYITDSKGEKISFNNTFIFLTNDIEEKINLGFDSKNNITTDELDELVDVTINFPKLTLSKLKKYLDKINIMDKEYIINNSNYEKDNYKNIEKLKVSIR